jgi:lipopolysaccharide transport system ATP-binding protein
MNDSVVENCSKSDLAIRLKSVFLSYKQPSLLRTNKTHRVLGGVSLDLRKGETLGIIGRNGAGKSTLMKVLAGLIALDSGIIEFYGHKVILLSYQLGFNGGLSGRDNAIYSGLLQGLSRKGIEKKMDDIIAFSGLEEAIDDLVSTYSAGMKARLGFAVAIQSDADIILIDEALGVGDREFREKSAVFMRKWIQSDKTIVFVSHDENSIKKLCDRVIWLEGGRTVAQGLTHHVLDCYHFFDNVVETFGKALNMTPAEVRAHENCQEPMKLISQVKTEFKTLWNNQDNIAPGKVSTVKFFRPSYDMIMSHCIEEECGTAAWVENVSLVRRGNKDAVKQSYDMFNSLLRTSSDALQVSVKQYRDSSNYHMLLSFIKVLGKPLGAFNDSVE